VFTSCAHICPATTQQLRRGVELARQALGTDSFNVVTIGFDVARDTPDMMAEFARRQRAELPGWDFLSADKATIDRLSAELGFVYQPAGGGFDHLIQSTIVDQDGVVYRQVYGIDFKLPHFVEPLKALVFGIEPDQSIYEELTNRIRIFCTVYDPASDSYRFSYSIFVGLVVGLLMGTAAIWALIREWRGYRRASKGAVGA
jgi:protein SCO1/2